MREFKHIPLNDPSYDVRRSQAVLQYGVGAMVDFPKQTLVTADGSLRSETEINKVFDERLARSLGVHYFGTPKTIAYTRFPQWYFCPRCRKFQPLDQWIADSNKIKDKRRNKDNLLIRNLLCPYCDCSLVVARLVTACDNGHLDDFPWIEWVHAKANRRICEHPKLSITTSASGSEGLDGILLACGCCGASTTLGGALDKDCFKELQKKCTENHLGIFQKLCKGHHPQKLIYENNCDCTIRAFQRGASAIYLPQTVTSLVIPPYTRKLNRLVEESEIFKDIDVDIKLKGRQRVLDDLDGYYVEKTLLNIKSNDAAERRSEIREILESRIKNTEMMPEPVSLDYRRQEYTALLGEAGIQDSDDRDFVRQQIPISEYTDDAGGLPFVKSISLITKIRIVRVLLGFSRIHAKKIRSKGYVSTRVQSNSGGSWFPGIEVRGEGIFIELDQEAIKQWVDENPEISKRIDILRKNYEESFIGEEHPREITPKLVLLHTLSHMLIKQLSFDCGYSVASLSERLYCAEKEIDGFDMTGILIYTSSGDSEGTLGGLVRQGRPDRFTKNFWKAVESAATCSNDPICIVSKGQGYEALNLAACHACALLPETCCEERNVFLDRGLLVGTYENPDIGFWSGNRLKAMGLER